VPFARAVRVVLVGTGVYPIPPTGYGGVERTIAELARALEGAGASVTLVHEVRGQRSIDEYRFAAGLERRLRHVPYDVVHASTPVVANRLRMAGRPYVYTTHSRHWFLRAGLRERWGYFLERRAVAGSRATIALTPRLQGEIRRALGRRAPSDLPVVPIGVDTDRFRPDLSARDGRHVLGVGVVRPFKRWEVAARALRGTGAVLEIAGPTPEPAYARELAAVGPHVHLLGELSDDDLARRFAESDLLVHPSRVELLAGVVLQGLAAGLPVVGADAVAELVEPGRTGEIAPPGLDDAALEGFFAAALRGLLADPERRRALGAAARRSAETRFAWPVVAREHLAVYRRALGAT
jgi:glycosyltransferase involved in cell wall biosynthesis